MSLEFDLDEVRRQARARRRMFAERKRSAWEHDALALMFFGLALVVAVTLYGFVDPQ